MFERCGVSKVVVIERNGSWMRMLRFGLPAKKKKV